MNTPLRQMRDLLFELEACYEAQRLTAARIVEIRAQLHELTRPEVGQMPGPEKGPNPRPPTSSDGPADASVENRPAPPAPPRRRRPPPAPRRSSGASAPPPKEGSHAERVLQIVGAHEPMSKQDVYEASGWEEEIGAKKARQRVSNTLQWLRIQEWIQKDDGTRNAWVLTPKARGVVSTSTS